MSNAGQTVWTMGALLLGAALSACSPGNNTGDGAGGDASRTDGDGATGTGTWAPVPIGGTSGTTANLYGVWGSAPDRVFAVGSALMRRWNGSAWVSASGADLLVYNGISGAGDVAFVAGSTMGSSGGGDTGLGLLLTASGSAAMFSMSTVPAMTPSLSGIHLRTATSGWAVGVMGTILRLNGTTWAASPSGTSMDLYNVFAVSDTDARAVGAQVLRWNGTAWAPENVGSTSYFYGIWASGPSDVWIAGVGGDIRHWDGTAWANYTAGDQNLYGVWGSGANDVWFVGDSGTIQHWNGSVMASSTSGTTETLRGIWGSSGSDIWVVGAHSTILRYTVR